MSEPASVDAAIEQLTWLVREDFAESRCVATYGDGGEWVTSWWQHPMGRRDITRIRSYIAAIRILRAPLETPNE